MDSESVSIAICELVSRASATSIRELPPLGRSIDTDALNAVFESGTSEGQVSFRYAGHDVLVRSSRVVEVYPEGTVTE